LTEDTYHQHLGRTLAALVGVEEAAKVSLGTSLILELLADTPTDFLYLQLHQARSYVAIAVVLRQKRNSFLLMPLSEEETGGLRDKIDRYKNYNTCEALVNKRDAPRPVIINSERN
jgi:hypothetical protein